LWDDVQAVLAANRVERATGARASHPSLLTGMVFDENRRAPDANLCGQEGNAIPVLCFDLPHHRSGKEPFLLAGKGYDTDAFRAFLKDQKIKPVIPGKSNRKKRIRHDKSAGKNRNVIARCLGRLKDFRRIATRYDKLAGNFFSALCLVAIVAYWL